jgi:Putative peptidoglycan binding domain
MAIRDVGNKGGPAPAPAPGGGQSTAGGIPAPLEKSLKDNGFVQQGQKPESAAQNVQTGLRAQGFQAPPALLKSELSLQLAAALKQFQAQNGLPVTGKLDTQTSQALKQQGINGQPIEDPSKLTKSERDGFEKQGAASLLAHGSNKRAELVNQAAPDTNFLDALLNQLGPGGTAEGTSPSDVKGSAATQTDAKVEAKQGADTKKGNDVTKKGTEAARDAELPNPQMEKGTGQGVKVARGLKAEKTQTEEKRRRDSVKGQDPTELGLLDEEADEDALEGAGDDGDKKRGHGGEHDGGGAESGDEDGTERERGNAESGDEDHANAKRGNAQLDDGSEAGIGHHRVPSVSEQVHAALLLIKKDKSEDNRATTYSWDVMFYKPGVYGAGQKAQELVHLVVDKAAAFDGVWQKAQVNLEALVKRADPGGDAPSLEDILGALRQARARDGGEDSALAKRPLKIQKPLGRA